jgi:hypothetical protein
MQELLNDISTVSGISLLQAETALGVLMTYLGARLPTPVMGHIKDEIDPRAHKAVTLRDSPSITADASAPASM